MQPASTLDRLMSMQIFDVTSDLFKVDGIQCLNKMILKHAKSLVCADRSTLYISLTGEVIELVPTALDKDAVSVSISNSICKRVASTGISLVVDEAHNDPCFEQQHDKDIGYVCKSLLSVAIPARDSTIGVITLINRLNDHVVSFNDADKLLIESFSNVCGLALQRTHQLDTLSRTLNKLEIVEEMLYYHSHPQLDLVNRFIQTLPLPRYTLDDIKAFSFNVHTLSNTDDQLVVIVQQMFQALGFCETYKITPAKCIHYILKVRKNYRAVAYHNFTHAVSVTHSLFLLITHSNLMCIASQLQLFAMFLAALSHDVDHRGQNNVFQVSAQTALARFYSTSTLEQHHFNRAKQILETVEIGMCEGLECEEYKLLLKELELAILATDLELFFAGRGELLRLIVSGEFDWGIERHYCLGRGIVMTTCDLGGMTKPFASSRQATDAVYSEFFEQGRQEIKLGLGLSTHRMDECNAAKIPSLQDEFFQSTIVPAFELLAGVLEGTMPLLDAANENHAKWVELKETGEEYVMSPSMTHIA